MSKKTPLSSCDMYRVLEKIADGDCPVDNVKDDEWLPEHEDHVCPVCLSRQICNTVAEDIRIGYREVMDFIEEENNE
jgi:hypothetical protein